MLVRTVVRNLPKTLPALGTNSRRFFTNKVSLNKKFSALTMSLRNLTTESGKLLQVVQGEIHHETSNYEPPNLVKDYLSKSGWKFVEKDGDVNMTLEKKVGDLSVVVDFQLVSPFEAEGDGETQAEMTDFSVTVENPVGQGVTFFCSTLQNDEKYRYIICNVRMYADQEAKNSVSSYNGPEFEDLDDTLQSSFDEWLASLGVDSELCDFIDACSIDKEQREYMVWLKGLEKFLSSK
uniref:Mitochondrial matrix family protein, putative n=1 Tax=Theileria annulata TaxID=5874 RepID=A0A3B0MU36_THEAN